MANKDNSTLPVPVDVIDLTQDSPINLSRRENKTTLNSSTRRQTLRTRASNNHDLDIAEDLSVKPSASIALIKDIINLDDTIQNSIAIPGAACETSKSEKLLPTICPICLEELTSALKPMSTRCGHVYCGECLQATLKAKKKCPKCQSTITEKTCIRLYF